MLFNEQSLDSFCFVKMGILISLWWKRVNIKFTNLIRKNKEILFPWRESWAISRDPSSNLLLSYVHAGSMDWELAMIISYAWLVQGFEAMRSAGQCCSTWCSKCRSITVALYRTWWLISAEFPSCSTHVELVSLLCCSFKFCATLFSVHRGRE